MKRVMAVLLIVLIAALAGCSDGQKDSNIVEIEQVIESPVPFLDKQIQIQGVVSQANSDKQLFSVISQREFQECGIAECNANEQLPVRFSGDVPEVGKPVAIIGVVKQAEKGFIYEAESVRNIEDLPDNK